MRKILLAASFLAGVSGAQAADMPDYPLRGGYSPAPLRPMWDGFYVGGQFGQSWLKTITPAAYNADLQAAYGARTAISPGATTGLPGVEVHKESYGGFIGYNSQFEDVVVGIEGNYMHSSIAANSIARSLPLDTTQAQTNVNLALTDFGSVRIRGGYMLGNFLPYAFVGVSGGYADISRTYGVTSNAGGAVTFPFETNSFSRFGYGYAAGAGIDVLLIGGLFARAEYEYSRMMFSHIDTTVNSLRVGVGYKF